MSPDTLIALLGAVAGVLLSLGAEFVPGFSVWFAGLDGTKKRLVMLGLLAGAALAIYAGACVPAVAAVFPGLAGLACDQAGALTLLQAFVSALVGNQSTYTLAHRPALPRSSPPSGWPEADLPY